MKKFIIPVYFFFFKLMSSTDDKPGKISECLEQRGNTSPHFHYPIQPEKHGYFSDLFINVTGESTPIDHRIYRVHSSVRPNVSIFPAEGHPLTCCVSVTLSGKQRRETEPGGQAGTQMGPSQRRPQEVLWQRKECTCRLGLK